MQRSSSGMRGIGRGQASRDGVGAMSDEHQDKPESNQPLVYEIRIRGQLDDKWTDWFEGLTVTLPENGDTLLTGPVADQAALHGLLKKVRDLGMPLVSVIRIDGSRADSSGASD